MVRPVDRAPQWPWSSAVAHAAGRGDAAAQGDWFNERIAGWVCTWREYLLDRDDADLAAKMSRGENTGRPLGDEGFVKTVGKFPGRDLLPKRPGRK